MSNNKFDSQPVSLFGSLRAGRPVPMVDVSTEEQHAERKKFLELMQFRTKAKPLDINQFLSAGAFYYTKEHYERVAQFNSALNKAAVDIVERWYSDEKRAFPDRMPLRAIEEKLLRVSENTTT